MDQPIKHEYLQAGDVRLRHAVFEAEDPRAAVVVLGGRTEYIEKYAEVIAEWRRRGYTVFSKDWRNQGLSDRPLADRDKHYVPRFETMVADLERYLDAIRPRAGRLPLVVFAHSMGAHVTLRYLAERDRPFAAALLSAPMVSIRFGTPQWLVRGLVRAATALGLSRAYAPGQGPARHGEDRLKSLAALTSDPDRFRQEIDFLADNPGHALGGVTYGWVKGALDSCDRLQEPALAGRIALPTLILQAGSDSVVDNAAMDRLAARLPDARLMRIDGALHELWREADRYRSQFWAEIDRFLAERGLPAAPANSGS